MKLINIEKLRGASRLVRDHPHLKNAKVADIFDRLTQFEDKSFALKSSGHKKYGIINIEDGRKPVRTENGGKYCHYGENPKTHGCFTWQGHPDGELLFKPGPVKDLGVIEYLDWDKETAKPAPWLWIVVGLLLWRILFYG
jgi:hypothetical protein